MSRVQKLSPGDRIEVTEEFKPEDKSKICLKIGMMGTIAELSESVRHTVIARIDELGDASVSFDD